MSTPLIQTCDLRLLAHADGFGEVGGGSGEIAQLAARECSSEEIRRGFGDGAGVKVVQKLFNFSQPLMELCGGGGEAGVNRTCLGGDTSVVQKKVYCATIIVGEFGAHGLSRTSVCVTCDTIVAGRFIAGL